MPWYICLSVFIAKLTYPIFTVLILPDCILNGQERRGEVKLHLRIANWPGQHPEAVSALLGWCYHLHNLRAQCDVQKIQIWQYSTTARHSSFIATYVESIPTISAEVIADCLWLSIVITPCGDTSCMDWEPPNFSKVGCAPLLWPARNTLLLLICTSLAKPFELCAWAAQQISHLLPCRVSFHQSPAFTSL